jgi:hypothetical protein
MSIGEGMAKRGWTLRSGGADGADTWFELGCNRVQGSKEIYLPRRGWNGNNSPLHDVSQAAIDLAADFHPAPEAWNRFVSLLMGRNSYQVLGLDLNTPCDLVICWSPGNGGTEQALRIARAHHIPIFNLFEDDVTTLKSVVKALEEAK